MKKCSMCGKEIADQYNVCYPCRQKQGAGIPKPIPQPQPRDLNKVVTVDGPTQTITYAPYAHVQLQPRFPTLQTYREYQTGLFKECLDDATKIAQEKTATPQDAFFIAIELFKARCSPYVYFYRDEIRK